MIDIAILLVMLLLSGFFSGSETALTSLSMVRVEELVKAGKRGAPSLQVLKGNPDRMLITLLIGNNLVNIGASAMATVLAVELFGEMGPGLAVGGLTILVLIFGEVTPKTFALRYASGLALSAAPPLLFFSRLVLPAVWVLERFTGWLQGLSSIRADPTVTESELLILARHGVEEGAIERDEQQMIQRIFEFDDIVAGDVMVPRHQIRSLDGGRTIRDALKDLLALNHSRIPLTEGFGGNIVRVVYLQEVLSAMADGKLDTTLAEIGHEPLFVPRNKRVDELFTTLRGKKRRLIIVVDPFGSVEGVCTLEDILEELVGEIYDDRDKPTELVQKQESGVCLADGSADLRMLSECIGRELTGKPTDPVSQWVLNEAESIPSVGECFSIDGLEVRIEKASRRRINQVRISVPS